MAHKTKQSALKAARKVLGAHAVEGRDFTLRNTGAGWEHETIEAANEPAKKARTKRAEKALDTKRAGRTDWDKVAAKTDAQIEADIASDPDAAPKLGKRFFKNARLVTPATVGRVATKAPSGSKTELLRSMMQAEGGATSEQMEAATGWAPHSVRGLIGTLKKRGVAVTTTKPPGGRTHYHIAADPVGDVV